MKNAQKLLRSLSLVLTIGLTVGLLGVFNIVQAASLTALSDTMSSSKISVASSHTIKFTTPSGTSVAGATIVITFPSDFNFTGKTIGTVTFTHGATTGTETTEVLAASATATAWGAAFSGTQNRIFTLTAPTDGVGAAALAANDKIIISYDNTNSINATTAGSKAITINGTFGDTGTITVEILTDDTVSVVATVPQTLSFSISDNTIGFGTLSSSAAVFATGDTLGSAAEIEANNLQAATNAGSGYTITVKGATLTSGNFTINAIGGINTASAPATEQFGLRIVSSGGVGAASAPYAASGFAYGATASASSQVASASAPSANTTYSVRYLANIGATTEAADYSTTLTYAATANF